MSELKVKSLSGFSEITIDGEHIDIILKVTSDMMNCQVTSKTPSKVWIAVMRLKKSVGWPGGVVMTPTFRMTRRCRRRPIAAPDPEDG